MEGVCTLWLFIDKIELWSWWPPFQHKPIILLFDKWLWFFKRLLEVQSTNTVSVILSCSLWGKKQLCPFFWKFCKSYQYTCSNHASGAPSLDLRLSEGAEWGRYLQLVMLLQLQLYFQDFYLGRKTSFFCRIKLLQVWIRKASVEFCDIQEKFCTVGMKSGDSFLEIESKKEKGSQ